MILKSFNLPNFLHDLCEQLPKYSPFLPVDNDGGAYMDLPE